jgi:hypothetical protein
MLIRVGLASAACLLFTQTAIAQQTAQPYAQQPYQQQPYAQQPYAQQPYAQQPYAQQPYPQQQYPQQQYPQQQYPQQQPYAQQPAQPYAQQPAQPYAQQPAQPYAQQPGPAAAPVSAPANALALPKALTLWGAVGYGGMYGVGARFMFPVGPSLLKLSSIRDQLAVELGVDYLRESYGYSGYLSSGDYSWSEILPVAGCMWQFWLLPNLAVYPKVDLGYAIGWLSGYDYCDGIAGCSNPSYGGFFWDISAGVMYTLGKVALRAELGNELVKGGVAFLF